MNESFIVYIDESGDEGFKFNPDRSGSSEWFVLSAVIVRSHNDQRLRQAIADVRRLLGKADKFPLHFRDLKHEHRIPYVELLAKAPIRVITILVHKPSLREPETFQNYRLYHYSVRLLLERVSWLCRDSYRKDHGDGSAKVVFSNRSAMSYQNLRDYVGLLLKSVDPLEVRIEPSVIRTEQILAIPHHQYAGLQAADAVASSFFYAVQPTRHGFCESRYVKSLSCVVYRRSGRGIGHGVKFWPKETDPMVAKEPLLDWAEQLFGKK